MPRRVERTRNMDTWTEAQFWWRIRSALRQQWRWWKPKQEARRRARLSKGLYVCALCQNTFTSKEIEVDHKKPCGSLRCYDDLPRFIERLFAEDVDSYRVLCKPCHNGITQAERKRAKQAKDMEHG